MFSQFNDFRLSNIKNTFFLSFTGSGSTYARVGAMITPYIAQVLLKFNLYSAIAVYTVLGMCCIVNCIFLPFETKGLNLNESGNKATGGRIELVNQDTEVTNEEEKDQ